MARQTQYQAWFRPVPSEVVAHPSGSSAVYPDRLEKKSRRVYEEATYTNSYVHTVVAPLPTFFSTIYQDIVKRPRRRTEEEFELIPFNPLPTFFSSIYQNLIERRPRPTPEEFEFVSFNTVIALPNFFSTIYPDTLLRKKRYPAEEFELTDPTVIPLAPPFFASYYPDEVKTFKRDSVDYSRKIETFIPPVPIDFLYNEIPAQVHRKRNWRRNEKYEFYELKVIVPSAADFHDLIWLTALSARLDTRREVDSGIVNALAADSSGTTVNFNKAFKDVESITVSVNDTVERVVIYDFTDVPNPTSFRVLVFNTAGSRVDATVTWMARGVI